MTPQRDHSSELREIVFKAWSDASFKERLKTHTVEVLAEYGIELPTGVTKVAVHENAGDTIHFVLPSAPDFNEFSESEIKKILAETMGPQLVFPSVLC